MDYRKVDAALGAAWLRGAFRLCAAHPAAMAALGTAFGLVGALPLVGSLALTLFGPALLAGLMHAAREAQAGRQPVLGHLFQAFRTPGRLPALVLLALPGILAFIVALSLLVNLYGAENLAALASGATSPEKLAPQPGQSLGRTLATIAAVGVLAYATTFFAVPLAMFDGLPAWRAMARSLAACVANPGALLVYVLALFAAVFALSLGFALLGMLLAALGALGQWLLQLAMFAVLLPLTAAGNLLAWQSVFGDAGAKPAARDDQAVAEL